MAKEVKIELLRIMGSKEPFQQSGSYRIILPKNFVRKYAKLKPNQPITSNCLEGVYFFFIETNRGVLLIPVNEAAKDPEFVEFMKGVQFAHPTGLSLKELSRLIDEEADKE